MRSPNQTLPNNGATSSTRDIISSRFSSDVKEQYDGTAPKSDSLVLPTRDDHKINHNYNHKHSIQENMVEHIPDHTSLRTGGDENGIKHLDVQEYYTESLKNPGWLTVLATFMLNFYTIGIVSSWGVFQVL